MPIALHAFQGDLLAGNINETGKAAFPGDAGSDGKKLLLLVIGRIALDFAQRGTSCGAGGVPGLGNLGHVRGYVFTREQTQPALGNQAFVIAGRDEKIKACGTSDSDFYTRQFSGYGDGIGEEQASARLQ